MRDGTGFEDLPIADLETFTKQGTLNQQDAPTEKIEVTLYESPLAAVERPDVIVTAIIPMPDTSDNLAEAMPIQSIPTSLQVPFVT